MMIRWFLIAPKSFNFECRQLATLVNIQANGKSTTCNIYHQRHNSGFIYCSHARVDALENVRRKAATREACAENGFRWNRLRVAWIIFISRATES